MSGVPLEVLGQIDNVDGLEGTFLHADTAPDAQWLGQVGDFGLGPDLDAELAEFHDGAGLFALLVTLFGLAFLWADDGDTGEVLLVSA